MHIDFREMEELSRAEEPAVMLGGEAAHALAGQKVGLLKDLPHVLF